MSVKVLISVVLRASKLQKWLRKIPNASLIPSSDFERQALLVWDFFLLLNQTAAAQGACLGEWHLINNSAHFHKNLLMILSWDIQLISNLAKNLRLTPDLCRIEQTVSVLVCKMEVLPTEATDSSVQSSIFIRAVWHVPKGKAAAGCCAELHCVPSGARGPMAPGPAGWRPPAEGITGEPHVWFHAGSLEIREAQGP